MIPFVQRAPDGGIILSAYDEKPVLLDRNWSQALVQPSWLEHLKASPIFTLSKGNRFAYQLLENPWRLVSMDLISGKRGILVSSKGMKGVAPDGNPVNEPWVALDDSETLIAFNFPGTKIVNAHLGYSENLLFVFDSKKKKILRVGVGSVRGWVDRNRICTWSLIREKAIAHVYSLDGRRHGIAEAGWVLPDGKGAVYSIDPKGRSLEFRDRNLKRFKRVCTLDLPPIQLTTASVILRPGP